MPVRYYQEIDEFGGTPLRREISIATASDAVTIPDNPGPGHTVDKALVWGGTLLERAITWVNVRAGRGPVGPIKEIMRAIHHELRGCWGAPQQCRMCEYHWRLDTDGVVAPPAAHDLAAVCEWLTYAANTSPRCPKCGHQQTRGISTTPLKSSKIKMLLELFK